MENKKVEKVVLNIEAIADANGYIFDDMEITKMEIKGKNFQVKATLLFLLVKTAELCGEDPMDLLEEMESVFMMTKLAESEDAAFRFLDELLQRIGDKDDDFENGI